FAGIPVRALYLELLLDYGNAPGFRNSCGFARELDFSLLAGSRTARSPPHRPARSLAILPVLAGSRLLPSNARIGGLDDRAAAHSNPDCLHRRSCRSLAPEISQSPFYLPLSFFQESFRTHRSRLRVRLRLLHDLPSPNGELVSLRSLEARLVRAAIGNGSERDLLLSKANARHGQGVGLRRRLRFRFRLAHQQPSRARSSLI